MRTSRLYIGTKHAIPPALVTWDPRWTLEKLDGAEWMVRVFGPPSPGAPVGLTIGPYDLEEYLYMNEDDTQTLFRMMGLRRPTAQEPLPALTLKSVLGGILRGGTDTVGFAARGTVVTLNAGPGQEINGPGNSFPESRRKDRDVVQG